jgi:hypothetical protein
VTVIVVLAEYLSASVAVTVTGVEPIGKVDPEGGLFTVAMDPPIWSTAVVAKFTTAPLLPVASTVMAGGTVITGGVFAENHLAMR